VAIALAALILVAIWVGWWLRWGRFWHPIREARWERVEWSLGHRQWSDNDGYVTYRDAWARAGGDPGEELHLPASESRAKTPRP
jgi:hypothetical protein